MPLTRMVRCSGLAQVLCARCRRPPVVGYRGGWATVDEAGRWIAERYPEQEPAKYGCGSWRQVVNESRFFDLRYIEVEGRRYARNREKERRAKPSRAPFAGRLHLTPYAAGWVGALLGGPGGYRLPFNRKSGPAPEAPPEIRIAPNAKQRLAPFLASISPPISSL